MSGTVVSKGRLAALVVLAAALGCTRPNDSYCENQLFQRCGAGPDAGQSVDAADVPVALEVAPDRADAIEARDAVAEMEVAPPECVSDAVCPSQKPICHRTRQVCVPCTAHAECQTRDPAGAGVCLAGGCPARPRAIFVDINDNACSPTGSGAKDVPFCDIKDALVQVNKPGEVRDLIVVSGGEQTNFSVTVSPRPITIVGNPVATVLIGASAPAIRLLGVDVALRSFKVVGSDSGGQVPGIDIGANSAADLEKVEVRGSRAAGIQAVNARSVRLNRALLDSNVVGLVLTDSPYSVTNTIVVGGASTTHGVVIEGAPSSTARFQNNTLVNNGNNPLTCVSPAATPHTASALLISPALAPGLPGLCSLMNYVATDAPLFDLARPYHLTKDSPCVGKGDLTDFPMDDYDGEPRKMGAASDCGADELTE